MRFQLEQMDCGLKVTLTLRHLGFWLKDQWERLLDELAGRNQRVYLDLGQVTYVDPIMGRILEERRSTHPQLELVGFPRGIR